MLKHGVSRHRNGLTTIMKLSRYIFLVIFAGISFPTSQTFAQKKWPGVVLYFIDINGITGNFIIDPVVRITKDKFSYPVPTPPEAFEGSDAESRLEGYFNRFCKEEYKQDRKLELFIDGNKSGSVKITTVDSLHSCSPVVSEVHISYLDSANLHFTGHGLVLASPKQKKTILNFPFDSITENSLYAYAQSVFLSHGVNKGLIEKVEAKDVRAVDIDGDGKPEYLVSYMIIGEEVKRGDYEPNMQYSLTMILKPTPNGGFKQLFLHYPDPGIPDESHYYRFGDVIDLDNDGNCEVIIQKRNYSSWDYILLKKKGDVWIEVYEGAGGGC